MNPATPSPTPPPQGEAGRWLLATAGERWSTTLQHPFFVHGTDGSLPADTVNRYFQIEHRFVATAVSTTAQAIALVNDLDARRRWAAALHHLLDAQIAWFHEVAVRRDLDLDAEVDHGGADGLHHHFAQLGDCGCYPELLAGVLGAEWLYATWCAPGAQQPGDLADWIELHRRPAFTGHVEWLLEELERTWASSEPVTRERAAGAFRATLAGEVEFHNAAYDHSLRT